MPPTSQTSEMSLPRLAKPPQPVGAETHGPADLVAAAKSGAGEALEQLLAEARPRLMALALRVLGNTDDAEDAVQDAMIKVWRNIKRFEGRAAFSTWLHRIAINAALDRLRRRGNAHMAADAPDEHPQEAAEATMPETPERIYARAETAVVVHRAISQLSDTHGEALRLCDLEGESYATIAAVTDCPLGTVMSRLFHARRKLARALTQSAAGDGDLAALRAA